MSEPSSSAPNATTPAKPEVSPMRNLIGLIVLVVVLIVGGMQVMAVMGYSSAVKKLNARAGEEAKDLMTEEEAESLMGGKKPDGEAEKIRDGSYTFLKKTYTWNGPIKSYPIYAYYVTSQLGTSLHHFETAQEKFVAEKPPASPAASAETKVPAGRPPRTQKGASGTKAEENKAQQPAGPSDEYKKAMEKAPAAKADDKKADDKAPAARTDDKKADDKAPAAKTDEKTDDKAPAAKADDKAPAAKADDKKADDKSK